MHKLTHTVLTAPDPVVLSPRELSTLVYLASGATNREIATELGISVKTIDTHRAHVLRKLGLRNNADLTRYAMHHAVIDADGVIDFARTDEIAKLRAAGPPEPPDADGVMAVAP